MQDGRIEFRDAAGVTRGFVETPVYRAGLYAEGLIPIQREEDGVYAYYNLSGEKAFGDFEYAGTFADGRAAVLSHGAWFLVGADGEPVSGQRFDDIKLNPKGGYYGGGIMAAAEDGKYYLFTSGLERIADSGAEEMGIAAGGLIAYKSDGKWGFINTDGKVVIEPRYEDAKSFSNGLGAVKIDGKWGFIEPGGRLVIDAQFEFADYFTNVGTCMISEDGEAYKLLKLVFS
jgi:hypothetical protein